MKPTNVSSNSLEVFENSIKHFSCINLNNFTINFILVLFLLLVEIFAMKNK